MTAPQDKQLESIEAVWAEHLAVAQHLSGLTSQVAAAVEMIVDALSSGGLLMVAGNGGSAADAQHIAAELTGRFFKDRQPLRALALHGNASALTAIGNDFGFERVFAREVLAHGRSGDVLLALSTSGNSSNILHAIDAARSRGVRVIGLTGASGGRMRELCDICLCVPSTIVPRVQEMHITIGHAICEFVEVRLG